MGVVPGYLFAQQPRSTAHSPRNLMMTSFRILFMNYYLTYMARSHLISAHLEYTFIVVRGVK